VGLEGDRQAEVIQLQAYWHDNLGVDVEWQALEVDVWLDRVIVEPPRIHLSEWAADYPDPDDFLRAMPFRRRTRWRNDAYDRLVEKARHATAQSERLKMYQQADAILVEEAPLMPIYYARDHILLKPWVSRLPTSSIRPGGWWKDVIIEPH
jgi:ABC-type oligopeptide transport system substrate-binding subunit